MFSAWFVIPEGKIKLTGSYASVSALLERFFKLLNHNSNFYIFYFLEITCKFWDFVFMLTVLDRYGSLI